LTQIDLNEGKFDLALNHASEAVKIQPNDSQANFVLGIVYAQIGKIEEAKKIMKQILTAYPDYKMARDALTQLENIKVGKS
jgi:Flp pilus assembly protein TadD